MNARLAARLDRDTCESLAYAEAQGAAPATEWPSGATFIGDGRRWRPGRLHAAAIALALLGLAGFSSAAFFHAKAWLRQSLLVRAWAETQRSGRPVKPWPWADFAPIARLSAPAQQVDMLVVEGANGHALAWAPGHSERSAPPGSPGNTVISGHRDTHFAFLAALSIGDTLTLEDARHVVTVYRVREFGVADHRALRLPTDASRRRLTFVTGYPFDAIMPGTPWRLIVLAEADVGVDRMARGSARPAAL